MKKSTILIAILLVILTIGAVSASDENITSDELTVSDDVDLIDVEEPLDKLALPEDADVESACEDNVLKEDSAGNFTELKNIIDNASEGSTIELDKDYKNYGSESQIIISKGLTIDGKGHTVDANKVSRVFTVTASNVVLKNIVFKNGASSDEGGAVCFGYDSTGTVSNCNFTDNKATGDCSYGGAVYFYNGGTVTNCNFINNTATENGGAVWMYSGTVTNCNFTGNTGGAIRMGSGTVSNCNFTGNKATGDNAYGGAIRFNGQGSVSNCNFINNKAFKLGGAIYIYRQCNIIYATSQTAILTV